MPEPPEQYDLVLLYASEDKDELAAPLAAELAAFRAFHVALEAISPPAALTLPLHLADLLRTSCYAAVIVSPRFPAVPWEPLRSETLKLLLDHVIVVRHQNADATLRRMSDSIEQFETTDTNAGLPRVARHLVSVLKADPGTYFGLYEVVRKPVEQFWLSAKAYIWLEPGLLPSNERALIDH